MVDYLEKDVENRLVSGVECRGGLCLKLRFVVGRGWPDRLVVIRGCFYPVELKKPGGRVGPLQTYWKGKLSAVGVYVRTLWTPAQVDAFLDELDRVAV